MPTRPEPSPGGAATSKPGPNLDLDRGRRPVLVERGRRFDQDRVGRRTCLRPQRRRQTAGGQHRRVDTAGELPQPVDARTELGCGCRELRSGGVRFLDDALTALVQLQGLGLDLAYRRLSRSASVAAFAALGLMVWFGSGAYGTNGGLLESAFILLAFWTPAYLAVRVSSWEPELV